METLAGRVKNYYRAIGVASVEVIDSLSAGDRIHIRGHTTDFDQTIGSMQLRHEEVTHASKGMVVGIKVNDFVRKKDCIYKLG